MDIRNLIRNLQDLPSECEWVEFKVSYSKPEDVGEYVSALSNSAALHRKEAAYLVWGIEDETHRLVGTTFKPYRAKKGGEPLEGWLVRQLRPRVDVEIFESEIDGHRIVVFRIQPAHQTPVAFSGVEYVRIGSQKKKLVEYPEKRKKLWATLSEARIEEGPAYTGASVPSVLRLIDLPNFFQLLDLPVPDNRIGIIDRLRRERVIIDRDSNTFDISFLGAILFAKNLEEFDIVKRKALRVIQYSGNNRIEANREQVGKRGYAVGFSGAVEYIANLLPHNEQIEQALRQPVPMYPPIAIRELLANALIHQDFLMAGTGPMVEIFSDRIEITNPGAPLIDTLRFLDEPPQSRNENLAAVMRRMNICEERGSGIDKVVHHAEAFQLPAPEFTVTSGHTKAVLYAPRPLNEMTAEERIRACYQHACLSVVSGQQMTNASLRTRFGVDQKNYSVVSRIIRDTIEAEFVRAVDPTTSKRYMKYVPFWA